MALKTVNKLEAMTYREFSVLVFPFFVTAKNEREIHWYLNGFASSSFILYIHYFLTFIGRTSSV